jgi:hypothetical protein
MRFPKVTKHTYSLGDDGASATSGLPGHSCVDLSLLYASIRLVNDQPRLIAEYYQSALYMDVNIADPRLRGHLSSIESGRASYLITQSKLIVFMLTVLPSRPYSRPSLYCY